MNHDASTGEVEQRRRSALYCDWSIPASYRGTWPVDENTKFEVNSWTYWKPMNFMDAMDGSSEWTYITAPKNRLSVYVDPSI